jgi:DNA gyrase subunit A
MAKNKKEKFNQEFESKVEVREIETEVQQSYLDYAMSVIVSRALPDVRDGLKPVHRRILYAMYEDGLFHNSKFRKSANVVGLTLAKYHPHGDLAVYDALVRMAQSFSLRYPLVEGQGNFGSLDGDPPAAQRYTECRLSQIGEELLRDINKETVDFIPNYDQTRKEPVVLPSPLPNLLLNGSVGIAVGMATNIPPHNLTEVCDALLYLISHPNASTEEVMQFIKGPDFPTGGIVYGKEDILLAYSQGKGPILMRGKAEIQELKNQRYQIVITEIPYQVSKSDLLREFAKLVEEKKVEGIKDIRDESDREGLRIVLDLRPGVIPQKILNSLYKFTSLEKVFYLNMLALVDGIQPKILSLVEVLQLYLNHKRDVVIRRTKYDLRVSKEREHILEGLSIAQRNIDAVIALIKKSENREDAKNKLMKRFKLTEIQANAILEIRLQSLAKLEREKIEIELKQIRAKIKELSEILASEKKLKEVIKKEIEEVKEKYGDERKTKIIDSKPGKISETDLIPKEETLIILTNDGYIKRQNPMTYKSQKRGGRGISALEIAPEDFVHSFILANTLDKILFFTDKGLAFQANVYEIPEGQRASKGKSILNFLEISAQEKILTLIPYGKDKENENTYFVMVTKNGLIKKVPIEEFKNIRRSGLIAIKLEKDDILKGVKIIEKGDEIILFTRKGKSILFKEKDLREMSRMAIGVRAMKLAKDDEISAIEIISNNTKDSQILLITENGFGKRVKIKDFRLQKRGGSGIKAINIKEKTGYLVFAKVLDKEEKEVFVISKDGQVIKIDLNTIPVASRQAVGVRLMKLKENDKVVAATCI